MRAAIYGGSFNPVHSGHVGIARRAVAGLHLDRLLVIPAFVSPFKTAGCGKGAVSLSPAERLELVRLAFEGVEKAVVDERELKRGGVSYAIDTVREVRGELELEARAKGEDIELFFIVGEDSLAGLPYWRSYDELCRLCKFVAYPRTVESSTEIRRRMAAGEDYSSLVPEKVAAFLSKLRRTASTAVLAFAAFFAALPALCGDEGLFVVRSSCGATRRMRDAIAASGAKIHGYMPDDAYLVKASSAAIDTMAGALPGLEARRYEPSAKRSADSLGREREWIVSVFDAADRPAVAARMRALEGCRVIFDTADLIRARIAPAALDAVASWNEVVWIDLSVVANSRPACDRAFRADAMNLECVAASEANPDGLTGLGEVVAVADTGLDTGDFATLHLDLRGRVLRAYAIGRDGDWSDPIAHGTHICGSIAGTGARSNGRVKGAAPGAMLIVQSLCGADGEEVRPTDIAELFRQAYSEEDGKPGARIHCDSWGAGRGDDANGAELLGVYIQDCRAIDAFAFDHPDFLVVFASGNDAVDGDADGVVDLDSLNSQATAKNALVVGGVENFRPASVAYGKVSPARYPAEPVASDDIGRPANEGARHGMAAFSGRGPCDDGRIKPDVVAPATMILAPKSTIADRGVSNRYSYHVKNGTSMAAPLVAGAAALLREHLSKRRGIANPDAATVKAAIVAGAQSISPGQYGEGAAREVPAVSPNPVEGWGLVDVGRSVGAEGSTAVFKDGETVAEGETRRFGFEAKKGASISAVLAYADAPAELAASTKLVNDIDLRLVSPSGAAFYPNGLSSPDRLNNVEKVVVDNAEPGVWTAEVFARRIAVPMPENLTGGRADASRFSLVFLTSEAVPKTGKD